MNSASLKFPASGLPPARVAIDPDDYHAEHVGRARAGKQFFLTTPFVPAWDAHEGREFIALYIFDAEGILEHVQIDELGSRAGLDEVSRKQLYEKRLRELGEITLERIEVRPFVLEKDGVEFGLVLREPEEDGDAWWVEVQPGNYMAFHEPWDSGEYDT